MNTCNNTSRVSIHRQKRAFKCDFLECGWTFAEKHDPEQYARAEYGLNTLQEQLGASSTSWDDDWYRLAMKGSSQKMTEIFVFLILQ